MQKIRAVLAVLVVGFFVALIVFNATRPVSIDEKVWNDAMAKGVKGEEAKKHYVMYTDIFCPYCSKYSNSLHANEEDFGQFLNDNKITYEIRVTDMNYLSGHSENSRPAGESIYCAAGQNKFFEYYKALLDQIFDDYLSKGIGVDRTSEKIPTLENDYYYKAGESAGLDVEALTDCVENHDALDELNKATSKAQNVASGIPYFVFGKQTLSGFDGTWDTDTDYVTAKRMLEAGL